jgi:hypothetical protein
MADSDTCGTRYLSSKKTVDDRALNQGVMARLRSEVAALGEQPLRVLEIGAGVGTMVARLADWQVVRRAQYRLVDVDPLLLREARSWLSSWAQGRGLAVAADGDRLRIEGAGIALSVAFQAVELGTLLADRPAGPAADLVIANAFLDLVEVPVILPPLFGLVVPGGLGFFTINFDGETIFLPEHPADDQLMQAYHRSMDERVRFGRPAGESKAGRRLFGHLRAAGASILAAGSSDWVVTATGTGTGTANGYEADEAFFLQSILDTVAGALAARPEIAPGPLAEWVALRRQQVDRGELTYLAHQLDFLVRCPRLPQAAAAGSATAGT